VDNPSGCYGLGYPISLPRSRLCFQRFDITISRRRIRYQRFEQMMRGVRNFVDGAIERFFVSV